MKFSALSTLALAATLAPQALAGGGKRGGDEMPGMSPSGGKKGGADDDTFSGGVWIVRTDDVSLDSDTIVSFNGFVTDFSIDSDSSNSNFCTGISCRGEDWITGVDTGSNTLKLQWIFDCGDFDLDGDDIAELYCPNPSDNMKLVDSACTRKSRTGGDPIDIPCNVTLGSVGAEHDLQIESESPVGCDLDAEYAQAFIEIECGPDVVSEPESTGIVVTNDGAVASAAVDDSED